MCGLGGIFSFNRQRLDPMRLNQMSLTLSHRGPDGEGTYIADEWGIFHRRLAVIDLSPRSGQPMIDPNKRGVLALNGEIYNYQELRTDLKKAGENFFSDGDTEVLLAGLNHYGLDFLSRVDGDFAFAYFDLISKALYLGRDRFGVKPLYYYQDPKELIFASEMRAILKAGVETRMSIPVTLDHLVYRYSQTSKTIFDKISVIPPGHFLRVRDSGVQSIMYWGLDWEAITQKPAPSTEELAAAWKKSVKSRMIADVNIGLLLSGGIDSSLIAQTCRDLGATSIDTFTYDVGGNLSETENASRLAEQLNFRHFQIRDQSDPLESLRRSIRSLEEPLGDSVLIANDALFEGCAKQLKVVLTGEGADEVFGGYAHQVFLRNFFKWNITLNETFGLSFSRAISEIAKKFINGVPVPLVSKLVPYPADLGMAAKSRALQILSEADPTNIINCARQLMNAQEAQGLLNRDLQEALTKPTVISKIPSQAVLVDAANPWMDVIKMDFENWLPRYGLLRLDKLSMAHSLECRVPYLQHEFVELALGALFHENRTPWARSKQSLRELAGHLFPKANYINRKKQPLFIPSMTNSAKSQKSLFREIYGNYFDFDKIKKNGLFDQKAISNLINSDANFLTEKKLVAILNLLLWQEEFKPTSFITN